MNEWNLGQEARLNGAGGVWPLCPPLQHRLLSTVASAETQTKRRKFHHTPLAPFECCTFWLKCELYQGWEVGCVIPQPKGHEFMQPSIHSASNARCSTNGFRIARSSYREMRPLADRWRLPSLISRAGKESVRWKQTEISFAKWSARLMMLMNAEQFGPSFTQICFIKRHS